MEDPFQAVARLAAKPPKSLWAHWSFTAPAAFTLVLVIIHGWALHRLGPRDDWESNLYLKRNGHFEQLDLPTAHAVVQTGLAVNFLIIVCFVLSALAAFVCWRKDKMIHRAALKCLECAHASDAATLNNSGL